jgi:uncharacterized integral membrane protein
MVGWLQETGEIYQGQFGSFTVDRTDRLGVVVYRTGLGIAATAVLAGTAIITWGYSASNALIWLDGLLIVFCLALGVSLFTIHIYLKPLHQLLKLLWAVGSVSALILLFIAQHSLVELLYPIYSIPFMGVGCVFVALTGLFVKEAFCFNHLESKVLTFLVPTLLLGHWLGWMPVSMQLQLLWGWAIAFSWFAIRKGFQSIPPDIGDKTVFSYLESQKSTESTVP